MPVTSAILSAAPGMLQTGAGLAQTIIGGVGAKKAQRQLENLQTPYYQPSKAIGDYYQEALSRYNTSPYQSAMYQQAQANIQRNLGTGIGALQDRRLGLAGVGAMVDQAGQQGQQALVGAERMRQQNFGTLGRAAQMQGGQDQMSYMYNQLLPFQRQSSLLGAKAAGYNRMLSAGVQNLFGGIGALGQMGSSGAQQGMFSGGGGGGDSGALSAASMPGLADTGGGAGSPAAMYNSINPNASGGASAGGAGGLMNKIMPLLMMAG